MYHFNSFLDNFLCLILHSIKPTRVGKGRWRLVNLSEEYPFTDGILHSGFWHFSTIGFCRIFSQPEGSTILIHFLIFCCICMNNMQNWVTFIVWLLINETSSVFDYSCLYYFTTDTFGKSICLFDLLHILTSSLVTGLPHYSIKIYWTTAYLVKPLT